ncbi:MAG: NYN domain-containing protein [Firmicutes bacterium]|nr:NYN domain-containing protein [Bacillota bacterium]
MSIDEKVALFIDFEYLFFTMSNQYGISPRIEDLINIASEYGELKVAKAFADLAGSEELRRAAYLLRTQSIEMVEAAGDHSREKVKNYTDFTMLDAIYGTYLDQEDIGTIVIVTGDGHFSSVVARLRVRCKKNIVVVGIPHFINRELYQSASEVRELAIDSSTCPIDRDDLIAFVTNSIHTHPYVTFNKTVSIYSKVRQVDEVAVRKALAALIDEGIFIQLIEHTPQSDVRVLRTPDKDDNEEAIA